MPRKNSREQKKRKAKGKGGKSQRVARAQAVLQDMRRDPSLIFTTAAKKRRVDPRWVLTHFGSSFHKDASGRIKPKPIRNSHHQLLHIPSEQPGVRIPVDTRNKPERLLIGRWMAGLNAAGRGDFSSIDAFPTGTVIGGVPLPTDHATIQRILNAMAEEEEPFEGLYRVVGGPR